jgi:hypothetical protein
MHEKLLQKIILVVGADMWFVPRRNDFVISSYQFAEL